MDGSMSNKIAFGLDGLLYVADSAAVIEDNLYLIANKGIKSVSGL